MGRFSGWLSLVWALLDLSFSHASSGATLTRLGELHQTQRSNPVRD